MGKYVAWYNDAGLRWCSGCKEYLEPDVFNKAGPSATTPDKRNIYCKLCDSAQRAQQYQRSSEREKAYSRAWRAQHPEYNGSKPARRAKRQYKLRRALADGTYARRLRRQARDTQVVERIRGMLASASASHQPAPSVAEVQRTLGGDRRRIRRLYLEAGGVVGVRGQHPVRPVAPRATTQAN